MNDKIINKIKKLFALGSNNSNQHEADSAMRMARKLLDKHNLSVYDLNETDDIGETEEVGLFMPWTRTIYQSIAKLYDVRYILDKNSKPYKHCLIGTESARVTASLIIAFVIKEIKDTAIGMGNGYRNSAANGVYHQVHEIIKERNASKEELIPGTGLLPINASELALKNIDEWIENLYGKIKKGGRNTAKLNSAGYNLGKNINLGAQLSNKKALN